MNAHSYNITVRQIEVDGENLFEARVRELPDVVDFGETWEEAYSLAVDTIGTTATIMAERDQQMPVPASVEDEYSGRVTLRVPKSLHRRLAEQAEYEGVSLNHYLVTVLAHDCGTRFGGRHNAETEWKPVVGKPERQSVTRPRLRVIDCSNSPEDGWRHAG
jgi:predicted HicB family RNase H-like nuclease